MLRPSERQALARIETMLCSSDPRLEARFAAFGARASGGRGPAWEYLSARRARRRVIQVAMLIAVIAVIALGVAMAQGRGPMCRSASLTQGSGAAGHPARQYCSRPGTGQNAAPRRRSAASAQPGANSQAASSGGGHLPKPGPRFTPRGDVVSGTHYIVVRYELSGPVLR